MRLPVLRFALVILCLPRADGSEPSTGCQGYAADEFFSTDLSSGVFPHNGYSPDSTEPECDKVIGPKFQATAKKPQRARIGNLRKLGSNKVICMNPGTCKWPPFEPRSHLKPADPLTPCFWHRALCSDTGYDTAVIASQTGQTLRAKDPNNRPVIDNSASPHLVVWELKYGRGRFTGPKLINLDFVNTKISVDVPGVKVRRIGA